MNSTTIRKDMIRVADICDGQESTDDSLDILISMKRLEKAFEELRPGLVAEANLRYKELRISVMVRNRPTIPWIS